MFNFDQYQRIFANLDLFVDGLLVTFKVALLGLILALILGIIFGVMSCSEVKILKAISRVYVEFFQNTPLLVQVFFIYNVLPLVNVVLSVEMCGIVGVGIYHGAYISEVVRTGIMAIDKGQSEAAMSQGFSTIQTMRYIILPQAIRIILPPLTNQAVNLIKNTSILAIIAGGDLMYQADSFSSTYLIYVPVYLFTGLLYFILCFPLTTLSRWLEEKSKQGYAKSSIEVG
ncbi:amino acid ABC transporter permease [Thomasclavelia sp.]|uniref:amino acid ABC transporter permease n=1 Tax=Thomasclavelia sp. TaxID=3025757 RepID=UPI0025F1DB6B|nr:amino acid ABC transporter permease [Thomasclavelia sp.]